MNGLELFLLGMLVGVLVMYYRMKQLGYTKDDYRKRRQLDVLRKVMENRITMPENINIYEKPDVSKLPDALRKKIRPIIDQDYMDSLYMALTHRQLRKNGLMPTEYNKQDD